MKTLFFFAGFLFFVFSVNSQNTFPSNGNVGIGTASPEFKLHVTAGVKLRKTTIGATLASAENSWLRDDWLTGSYGPPVWNQGIQRWVRPAGTYNDIGGIIYQDEGTYFIRDYMGEQLEYTNNEFLSKAYLFAHITSGNIGIGTTTPKTKLHIFNGASNGNSHGFADLTVEDDDHVMVTLLTPNNKAAYYGFADQDDDYVAGIQYEHSIDRMVFRVSNHTSDMVIINNGNVGIGTTNPDSKLTVAGNIHSREVKVTVNAGADFVFEDNYNLPSLEEVQQFIQENGHLPEIASAKDMEANGIHLSEMNIKLLQKIEELTLYAIEQEQELKKVKELENKVQVLEEENKALKEVSVKLLEFQARLEKMESKSKN